MMTNMLEMIRFVKKEAPKMAALRKARPLKSCQKMGTAALVSGKSRF